MLDQIILLTNADNFHQNGYIKLKQLLYVPDADKIQVVLQIASNFDEGIHSTTQLWEIECTEVAGWRPIERVLWPYVNIRLLTEHPLSWNYEYTRHLTLRGRPKNLPQLLGGLFTKHIAVCGNWLDFNHLFRAVYNLLPDRGEVHLEMPERLVMEFKGVFEKYDITMIDEPGRQSEPDFRLLFFGNEGTSPNNYNFFQPYVVAKNFSAKLLPSQVNA